MIKKLVLIILTIFVSPIYCVQDPVEQPAMQMQVSAKNHEKISLLLVVVGAFNETLGAVATVIKKDLEFNDQFAVTLRSCERVSTKGELQGIAKEGFSLALFINESTHNKAYEWRLYDTQGAQMVKGKKYHRRGELARGWGHNIADALWPELTGQEGFFSTKIAYCKEITSKRGHRLKHIYVADFDGSHEQRVVATPTINVAPRFNHDQKKPMLFYSESTSSNIRLMLVDMNRTRKVASNFDGINMLPSFSSDGSKLVYCASHGHGNCQLYYYQKGTFKQITNNSGNNISPTLSDDGTKLYYCSDCIGGKPQIYCYDLQTGSNVNITSCNESCFSPTYYSKKGQVAYAKMLKGTMQLFLYDEKKGKHRQLTFDAGSKDECSWSPCGNYLLYSMEKGDKGMIGMLNIVTLDNKMITAHSDICSYPTWSPIYAHYPVIA